MRRLTIALVLYAAVAQAFTADAYRRQVLANNFTTTLATAQATPLSTPVAPNEVYVISVQTTTSAGSAGGMKYQIQAPVGAVIEGWLLSSGANITAPQYVRVTAINTFTSAVHLAVSVPGPDQIWFRLKNGANAGNVTLAVASVLAGQTTTVFAGSYWRVVEAREY